MTTTRRLSGLQGGSHQQTSLMLDSYEACASHPRLTQRRGCSPLTHRAVKRKHLAQNKEIIQKNSELHKCVLAVLSSSCRPLNFPIACRANADLQRQISLMRAERLSLKGTQFQLECENAALRDKLDRSEDRERRLIDERDRLKRKGGGVLDDGQLEVRSSTLHLERRRER